MWPCRDLKVIIKPRSVKGAQILEMKTENRQRSARQRASDRVWVKAAERTSGPFCLPSPCPLTATGSHSAKEHPSTGAVTSTHVTASLFPSCFRSDRSSVAAGRNDTMGTTCPRLRKDMGDLGVTTPARSNRAKTLTPKCAPEEWPTTKTSLYPSRNACSMLCPKASKRVDNSGS